MSSPATFRPALLIVDVQEDFCPPNGALAIAGGRDIVPTVNALLALPFTTKIATKDHHPPSHVSFASNHPNAQPFISTTIMNPANPAESYETRLWPGTEPRVEMYSAFRSPLRAPPLASAVSDLADRLSDARITDVFVVGLAGDYCVCSTAIDAAELGWKTYVVEEGTRSVGGEEAWKETAEVLKGKGVKVVSVDGPEVRQVKALRVKVEV
ncbi:Isochorismatase-like protein [Fomes fomentarius]|nr:Isochorismatase-like protein [Fomes fomentarius]